MAATDWTRAQHAELVAAIAEDDPVTVAYDVVFDAAKEGDDELAAALADAGVVVLAASAQLSGEVAGGLPQAISVSRPTDELAAAAAGVGNANVLVSRVHGTAREVPLVVETDDRRLEARADRPAAGAGGQLGAGPRHARGRRGCGPGHQGRRRRRAGRGGVPDGTHRGCGGAGRGCGAGRDVRASVVGAGARARAAGRVAGGGQLAVPARSQPRQPLAERRRPAGGRGRGGCPLPHRGARATPRGGPVPTVRARPGRRRPARHRPARGGRRGAAAHGHRALLRPARLHRHGRHAGAGGRPCHAGGLLRRRHAHPPGARRHGHAVRRRRGLRRVRRAAGDGRPRRVGA